MPRDLKRRRTGFPYSGFHVDSNFESAIAALGPGAIRISHYGYRSNEAALANGTALGIPSSTLMQTLGDAVDVSYAQNIKKCTIGATIVPQDSGIITLRQDGVTLVSGTAHEDYGGRFGGVIHFAKNLRFGADYSYQRSDSTAIINPLLVPDATGPVSESEHFITRASTVGASWKLLRHTMIYGSYQDILSKGGNSGDRYHALQRWAGVQQDINPKLVVRASYLSGGQNYMATWTTPIGLVNVAYTHRALANAEYILGKGDAFFGGLAVAFK